MSNWAILRPETHRQNRPDRTWGLVMLIDGRRYFFPGSTPMLAGFIAEAAFGRAKIEGDNTTLIEWGNAASGVWVCERVLKKIDKDKEEYLTPEEKKKAEALAKKQADMVPTLVNVEVIT